jgi:hypothetical protein
VPFQGPWIIQGLTVGSAPKETQFDIWLNITVPYMPITSDGKAPDLTPFLHAIRTVVGKAVRAARGPTPEPGGSLLPKRRRGRQSPEDDDAYHEKVEAFCGLMRQIYSRRQPRLLLSARTPRAGQRRVRRCRKADHRVPQVRRLAARHLRRGCLA